MKAILTRSLVLALLLHTVPVQSQTCPELPATTLTSFISENKFLTFKVGGLLRTAWKAYVAAPDDEKLEAVMFELGMGGAGLSVPGLGILIKTGRIYIDGVEYTVDEARRMQIDAFLCGGVSGGERLPGPGFFETRGAQQISPGITCDNFAERIETADQFQRLESLFRGFYTRNLLELGGRQNRDAYRQVLDEQWAKVTTAWKVRMGARLLDGLKSDLARLAAVDAQVLATCEPDPALAVCTPDAWNGTWRTEYGEMVLSASGSSVSGTYPWDDGQISGTLDATGCILTGGWTEVPSRTAPNDAGGIVFTLDPKTGTWSGIWGYGNVLDRSGWTGSR